MKCQLIGPGVCLWMVGSSGDGKTGTVPIELSEHPAEVILKIGGQEVELVESEILALSPTDAAELIAGTSGSVSDYASENLECRNHR